MIKEFKQHVGMHNKFHLVLTDARTNKVKQEGWAYNIMLDKCIERVRNQFTDQVYTNEGYVSVMLNTSTYYKFAGNCRIGGFIHLGTGTGVLDRSRTSLFTFLSYHTTVKHANALDLNNRTGWYTQKGTWLENEIQNVSITEVGLAAGTAESHLNTHALVEDSEGNPISINKGTNDILTVYATVYVSIGSPLECDNFKLVNGSYGNYLLTLFIKNGKTSSYFSNNYRRPDTFFKFGSNGDPIQLSDGCVKSSFYSGSKEGVFTAIDSRSCYLDMAVPAASGNHVSGIREIGVDKYLYNDEDSLVWPYTTTQTVPLFRAIFPIPGVWEGFPMTGEQIATGDGSTQEFNLKWTNPTQDSVVMKLDGIAQTEDVDYTVNYTGTPMIVFSSPPGLGVAITADYEVPYIFRLVLSFRDDGEIPTAVSATSSILTDAEGTVTISLGSVITGLVSGNITIRKNVNTVLTDTVSYTLAGLDTDALQISFTETADIQGDDELTVTIRKSGYTINADSPVAIPVNFS